MVKKEISKDEVLFYLEEMIEMELASEIEEDVYYDIKYKGKCNKQDYKEVLHNMRKWYTEKF